MENNIFLIILGAIFVIEGLPYFVSPQYAKKTALFILGLSELNLRILGITFISLGFLIIMLFIS